MFGEWGPLRGDNCVDSVGGGERGAVRSNRKRRSCVIGVVSGGGVGGKSSVAGDCGRAREQGGAGSFEG
jgi:hypothetical protein